MYNKLRRIAWQYAWFTLFISVPGSSCSLQNTVLKWFHVYDICTHFHCLDLHDGTNVLWVLVFLIVSYTEKSILITLLPNASPKIPAVPELQPHYCYLWQGRKATAILSGFHRAHISFHPPYTNYWSALDKRTLMKKPRTLLSSVKENQYSNLEQPLYYILLYHTSGRRRTHDSVRRLWWHYKSDDNCGRGQTNAIMCKELGFLCNIDVSEYLNDTFLLLCRAHLNIIRWPSAFRGSLIFYPSKKCKHFEHVPL